MFMLPNKLLWVFLLRIYIMFYQIVISIIICKNRIFLCYLFNTSMPGIGRRYPMATYITTLNISLIARLGTLDVKDF